MGKKGSLMPKAMAQTAPSDAPEDIPRVEPSARGFFNNPCIQAPLRERQAPVSPAQSTLGMRTLKMMEDFAAFSWGMCLIAFDMI